jgi:hypothetical protein
MPGYHPQDIESGKATGSQHVQGENENKQSKILRARCVPLPLGGGVHVGHRWATSDRGPLRLRGFSVLHPMFDSFRAADEYAIQTQPAPAITTEQNISTTSASSRPWGSATTGAGNPHPLRPGLQVDSGSADIRAAWRRR